MKALTLHQPWASLVALGVKTIETRGWQTSYRGPLAIHAGKASVPPEHWGPFGPYAVRDAMDPTWRGGQVLVRDGHTQELSRGAVVAICRLVEIVPMVAPICIGEHDRTERVLQINDHLGAAAIIDRWVGGGETVRDVTDQMPYGDFAPGRFAWMLEAIMPASEPIPAKGKQGLWNWTPSPVSSHKGGELNAPNPNLDPQPGADAAARPPVVVLDAGLAGSRA